MWHPICIQWRHSSLHSNRFKGYNQWLGTGNVTGGKILFPICFFLITLYNHVQCIVISWFYGMDNFSADLVSMSVPLPRWLRWVWTGLFVVIIPAALAYMYIYSLVDIVPMSYRGYEYPDVAEAFGWFFIILPLVFVGIYAVWFVLHAKMTGLSWGELARAAFQTEVWGRLGEKVAHTRKGEIEESLTVHRDSTRKI